MSSWCENGLWTRSASDTPLHASSSAFSTAAALRCSVALRRSSATSCRVCSDCAAPQQGPLSAASAGTAQSLLSACFSSGFGGGLIFCDAHFARIPHAGATDALGGGKGERKHHCGTSAFWATVQVGHLLHGLGNWRAGQRRRGAFHARRSLLFCACRLFRHSSRGFPIHGGLGQMRLCQLQSGAPPISKLRASRKGPVFSARLAQLPGAGRKSFRAFRLKQTTRSENSCPSGGSFQLIRILQIDSTLP